MGILSAATLLLAHASVSDPDLVDGMREAPAQVVSSLHEASKVVETEGASAATKMQLKIQQRSSSALDQMSKVNEILAQAKSVKSLATSGLGAADAELERRRSEKEAALAQAAALAAAPTAAPDEKQQYDAAMKMLQNITDMKKMLKVKDQAEQDQTSLAQTEVVEERHVKSEAQRYANFTKKMMHNETVEMDGIGEMVKAMDKMARNATRGLAAYDEMKLEQEKSALASGYELSADEYQGYQASLLEVGAAPDAKAGAKKTLDEMDQIDAMMSRMDAVAQKRGLASSLAETDKKADSAADKKLHDQGAQKTLDEMDTIDAMLAKMSSVSGKAHQNLTRDANGQNPYVDLSGAVTDQLSATLETVKKSSLIEDDEEAGVMAGEMEMLQAMIKPQ